MASDTNNKASGQADLAEVVGETIRELRCLLGPVIQLETACIAADKPTRVRANPPEIVNLLRHLALDAHDAMPAGGTVSIRTGRLGDVPECGAIIVHEVPTRAPSAAQDRQRKFRKGRSLGLAASYDAIERNGGHLHVSCRGCETVLTICFPLARRRV